MEYKRIVAVTGLSGLFEVVSSKNDGALLRSLEDGTTRFVSSRVHNLSHLESIEIFTEDENVNLVEVFNAMKNSSEALPDAKDNGALKSYFEKVYPAMDFERVYTSDMKKMVKWFEVLQQKGIDIQLPAQEGTEEETPAVEEVPVEETVTAEAPETPEAAKPAKAKKAPKKKTGE